MKYKHSAFHFVIHLVRIPFRDDLPQIWSQGKRKELYFIDELRHLTGAPLPNTEFFKSTFPRVP